jgi:HSP20 family molecular chaperone IbpA
MKDEPQDVFRQMDAMFKRMVEDMTSGMVTGMPPNAVGFRIILQGSGMPQVPPYDGIADSFDLHETAPEVHCIGNEVKVVAELPGADKESIQLKVSGGILTIEADGQGRHFSTCADLPPVDAASVKSTFRNGILEVTFDGPNVSHADEKHDP